MQTLFVELTIPDTTADTALRCLQKMKLPIRNIKKMDMYEYQADKDITQQLMNTDIIANKHKHRCKTTLESGNYIQVKDKEQSNSLFKTLKERLGIEVAHIEKSTLWNIESDEKQSMEQAAKLLCNRHYQEWKVIIP